MELVTQTARARARWFWVATTCNVVAIAFLVLLIYAALVMLALFSSPASMLPFLLAPAIVLILSVIGFSLSRGQRRGLVRWLGYVVHASGFLLSLSMLCYLGFLWSGIGSGKETYLIPNDYQGDIYVIHPVENGGAPSNAPTAAIYLIPPDGILVAPNAEVRSWSGWTKTRYYYLSKNGQRREITEHWDSTIPETAENLANTKDIGIYFPTTGTVGDGAGCHARLEHFSVGTKAYLLRRSSQYREPDWEEFLRKRNAWCTDRR
jgi:uncharacterized protein DUF6843